MGGGSEEGGESEAGRGKRPTRRGKAVEIRDPRTGLEVRPSSILRERRGLSPGAGEGRMLGGGEGGTKEGEGGKKEGEGKEREGRGGRGKAEGREQGKGHRRRGEGREGSGGGVVGGKRDKGRGP